MPTPDGRHRRNISLTPKVFTASCVFQRERQDTTKLTLCPFPRIPNKLVPRLLLSNVLYVSALFVAKEWLLDFEVGVFWVLIRVLACAGLGVFVWEARTGQLAKRKSIEVRPPQHPLTRLFH